MGDFFISFIYCCYSGSNHWNLGSANGEAPGCEGQALGWQFVLVWFFFCRHLVAKVKPRDDKGGLGPVVKPRDDNKVDLVLSLDDIGMEIKKIPIFGD